MSQLLQLPEALWVYVCESLLLPVDVAALDSSWTNKGMRGMLQPILESSRLNLNPLLQGANTLAIWNNEPKGGIDDAVVFRLLNWISARRVRPLPLTVRVSLTSYQLYDLASGIIKQPCKIDGVQINSYDFVSKIFVYLSPFSLSVLPFEAKIQRIKLLAKCFPRVKEIVFLNVRLVDDITPLFATLFETIAVSRSWPELTRLSLPFSSAMGGLNSLPHFAAIRPLIVRTSDFHSYANDGLINLEFYAPFDNHRGSCELLTRHVNLKHVDCPFPAETVLGSMKRLETLRYRVESLNGLVDIVRNTPTLKEIIHDSFTFSTWQGNSFVSISVVTDEHMIFLPEIFSQLPPVHTLKLWSRGSMMELTVGHPAAVATLCASMQTQHIRCLEVRREMVFNFIDIFSVVLPHLQHLETIKILGPALGSLKSHGGLKVILKSLVKHAKSLTNLDLEELSYLPEKDVIYLVNSLPNLTSFAFTLIRLHTQADLVLQALTERGIVWNYLGLSSIQLVDIVKCMEEQGLQMKKLSCKDPNIQREGTMRHAPLMYGHGAVSIPVERLQQEVVRLEVKRREAEIEEFINLQKSSDKMDLRREAEAQREESATRKLLVT